MLKLDSVFCAGIALLLHMAVGGMADEVTLQLARELSDEAAYGNAALEFRRLAATSGPTTERGAYYWMAAYAYYRSDEWGLSDKMLNSAETLDATLDLPTLLLRAENAVARQQKMEADFYLHVLRENPAALPDLRRYAARRSACLLADMCRPDEAIAVLELAPGDNDAGMRALSRYAAGRDKKPVFGGVLGLVPGLGYAYSGEYANALRSLILNGLFIFGMVHTAENDQWGAFGVITFFEITWYSGSIYGGIDAAHRYNRRRLEDCCRRIMEAAEYQPDLSKLPVLSLQFTF